ncbi:MULTISPECIES: outer membrane protein [unclassified Bartonella]|uniref:outer membrane protein n=1 Tax=unclassified Bartonella TaxID=2645622 RepID=UPI00300DCD88
MNRKSLVTTAVIALISVSVVQAADVTTYRDITTRRDITRYREAPPLATFTPRFSWGGSYLGGQVGNFLSKINMNEGLRDVKKSATPKLSGFMGGIYAGSNVDLKNGFVFGVETDAVWANREDTKQIATDVSLSAGAAASLKQDFVNAKITDNVDNVVKENSTRTDDLTLREKWSGATRIRFGFVTADRFMPYVAGGIAYTQLRGIDIVSVKESGTSGTPKAVSGKVFNETKMMVGYTVGAGVDFAMIDNIIMRAEYRYSDFGTKKFLNEQYDTSYKTNDFRVGVAYKF